MTGIGIHDVMYCAQRRDRTVPCSSGVLKWVATNREATEDGGRKGDSSLTVHMHVIVLYVLIGIIWYYTLRCTDDAVPLRKNTDEKDSGTLAT